MNLKKHFLILFSSFILKLNSAEECNLARIFRTPKDMAKVNFDHFELIERANFEEGTTTEAPKIVENNEKNPKTFANAQVMLRFGGDDVNLKNKFCKSRFGQNFIPSNIGVPNDFYHNGHMPFYPQNHPSCHPCYYHPYPPPVPFTFPNYYYYCPSGVLPKKLEDYLKENAPKSTKNDKKNKKIKVKKEKKVCGEPHEYPVEKVETKEHPEILKTVDLSKDKPKDSIKNNPQHIENLLSKSLVAYRERNDPNNPKFLITYPITTNSFDDKPKIIENINLDDQNIEEIPPTCQNCNNCGQRNPNTPFGKRFSNDIDNLLAHSISAKSSSGYISQNNDLKPEISFGGYSCNNREGFYKNPSRLVYYTGPSKTSLVEGNNNFVNYKQYEAPEEIKVVEEDKNKPLVYFKAVPKYDIIPKYDVNPVDVFIVKNVKVPNSCEAKSIPFYNGENNYYCPTCSKEIRQLNDW